MAALRALWRRGLYGLEIVRKLIKGENEDGGVFRFNPTFPRLSEPEPLRVDHNLDSELRTKGEIAEISAFKASACAASKR